MLEGGRHGTLASSMLLSSRKCEVSCPPKVQIIIGVVVVYALATLVQYNPCRIFKTNLQLHACRLFYKGYTQLELCVLQSSCVSGFGLQSLGSSKVTYKGTYKGSMQGA